jgi:dynein heavy chain
MFLETYDTIPYSVIRFLCGEINYGGRVTEQQDRILLITLLEGYIHPGIHEPGYKYSPSGQYVTTNAADCKQFLRVIQYYPAFADPEIFGLHTNADITGQQNATSELLSTILNMQPRNSASRVEGDAREGQVTNRLVDMLAKMPNPFSMEDTLLKFPSKYEESMNTVLTQECVRFNDLLEVMSTTLQETMKALKGLVVMNPELEAIASAVYDNRVRRNIRLFKELPEVTKLS